MSEELELMLANGRRQPTVGVGEATCGDGAPENADHRGPGTTP